MDDYEESEDEGTGGQVLTNQPYDEALDVSDPEEIPSTFSSPQGHPIRRSMPGISPDDGGDHPGLYESAGVAAAGHSYRNSQDDPDVSEGSSNEDDDPGAPLEGAYDPQEFAHLPVSEEIQQLFQFITKYKPQQIELETKLRPFLPDYIPTVGDIDAFLKVGRPDRLKDQLGLTVLDEPVAKQSDPTVLDLQLRTTSKQTTLKAMAVRSLQNPDKNPKALDNWIQNIGELHRQKPAPNVHYQKSMPSIGELMQAWPPEFEEMLQTTSLPTAELDCELKEHVDIICGMLDIPVHQNRIHSLHLLFSLYSEFKNSQHFRSHEKPFPDSNNV